MSRRPQVERDQDPTVFAAILAALCRDSGAICAALVDAEGETVDYGGRGDPFEIRVLAAELRLLQQLQHEGPALGDAHQIVIRARRRSFLLETLPEGYALAVELPRRASGISHRALSVAVRAICLEAGFPEPPYGTGTWLSISVSEEGHGSIRPERLCIDGVEQHLVVLGKLAGDSVERRERGYRVRLGTGRESNLVREALGRWYLEDD